tara:strand:- start:567 stop:767 length:201 start_codon:yes stop_codon:yes gene_type:complete
MDILAGEIAFAGLYRRISLHAGGYGALEKRGRHKRWAAAEYRGCLPKILDFAVYRARKAKISRGTT